VRLQVEPRALMLEVEDHGRGLTADITRGRGLGLVAMRERAELVNGSIELLTPPGGGTVVRLKVPLSAGAEAPALHTSIT
jgi:signal transduction histidine kinase